jgi:hypothetical protein
MLVPGMFTNCYHQVRVLISLILFFLANHTFGQINIQGTVVDANSLEPLAFVNIQVKGTTQGTSTNTDGKYFLQINSVAPDQELEFSVVGYEKRTYAVKNLTSPMKVALKPTSTQLQEILIEAGANPAHKIIRKAVAAKPLHDPNSLNSYSFNCYNKTIYTASGLENDSIATDSVLEKNFRYGHLFVLESYSEVKRMRPNLSKETVLKNRVSGWENPKLAMLSSSFQPFAFYEDQVNLFGTLYVNPLSDGSLNRYEFYLVDSLFSNQDTTYILSFEPYKKIEFKTLKGLLFINSNGYAIENVIASPADSTMKVDFRIQQKYEFIQGRWFPKELYTRYLAKENGIKLSLDSSEIKNSNSGTKTRLVPLVLKNQSYFSNIKINPPLSRKDFDLINVEYNTDALNHQSWSVLRPDSLSARELQTYFNYDTLNPKFKRIINRTADISLSLAGGTLSLGKISILPNYLLRFNRYEKAALGLGLSTNENLSRLFKLQGFGMYGFGDQAFKYGGNLQLNLNQQRGDHIQFHYSQDIQEPGTINYIKPNGIDLTSGGDAIRKFIASRMDSVERISVSYNFRPVRYTQVSIFSNREHRTPTYNYQFLNNDNNVFANFTITEVGLNIKFLFKESITKAAGLNFITGNSFPYITARISKGFDNLAGGDFSFTKADIRLKHVIRTIALGKTTLYVSANKVWGDQIPYSLLHVGNSFRFDNSTLSVYTPGYFQTMPLYEFTSDTYGQISLEHNFGPLFTALKGKSQPELVIVQSSAYGSLRNKDAHLGVPIKTMEKGFHESGLMLNNLLRIDSKLYWLGYGAGVFYRFGAYAMPNQKDNLVFVLSSSIKL